MKYFFSDYYINNIDYFERIDFSDKKETCIFVRKKPIKIWKFEVLLRPDDEFPFSWSEDGKIPEQDISELLNALLRIYH